MFSILDFTLFVKNFFLTKSLSLKKGNAFAFRDDIKQLRNAMLICKQNRFNAGGSHMRFVLQTVAQTP